MRLLLAVACLVLLGVLTGCSSSNEGSSGRAAGDAVAKDLPKSTGKYDDMPQPGGGMERGTDPATVKK